MTCLHSPRFSRKPVSLSHPYQPASAVHYRRLTRPSACSPMSLGPLSSLDDVSAERLENPRASHSDLFRIVHATTARSRTSHRQLFLVSIHHHSHSHRTSDLIPSMLPAMHCDQPPTHCARDVVIREKASQTMGVPGSRGRVISTSPSMRREIED